MTYWKTLRRVMAALVAITALAIFANAPNEFSVHSASASTIVQTFKPVADAWVNSQSPDTVSGTGYELQVDGSPIQIAYFTFNLSALSGSVISATLTLSVTGNGSVDAGSVSTVSDTSWTETTLTYNNHPALSAPIASLGAAPANQALTVDVTSAVTSSGVLGLAVASTNGDGVSFASRENSRPPLLTVTVGTATPTSTATATNTPTSTTTATATATNTATSTATATATSTATTTATATPSPTPTGTPTSTQTYIFRASADAYANSSAPDTVSGTGYEIPVDGSPDRLDYLTFNVTGLSGTIMSATLKLTTTWDGSVDGGTIGKVLDTSWTESTLTYNNRPAISPPTVAIGSISPYQSVSKDVTAAITGNGLAGFAISSTSGDGVTYASRENSTPPILTIVTGVFGTPTPTPTATATATGTPTATATTTATATGTATATATATATPTGTPTATPTGGIVIAAAGDISCDPTSSHFNNGNGDPTHCQQKATSDLLMNMPLSAVLTLGDNQYNEGTLAQYQAVFDGTWGRLKSIIRPIPGNHEYRTANGAGYYAYFGAAAGDPSKGWYSYDIGSWHFIALNGECADIGGCSKGSPQEVWLKNDLATHQNQCTIAYWHEPEFDSGPNGSGTFYLDFWNDLYRGGAEIVLNGHSHLYERFGPQTPTGVADPDHGVVQFTVGSGGEDLDNFHNIRPNSMARDSDDFGVLKLTLHDGSYSWQYVTIPGSTSFTDTGSANCHAAP